MCYLVAKDCDAHGCFALKTTHGKHLSISQQTSEVPYSFGRSVTQ